LALQQAKELIVSLPVFADIALHLVDSLSFFVHKYLYLLIRCLSLFIRAILIHCLCFINSLCLFDAPLQQLDSYALFVDATLQQADSRA